MKQLILNNPGDWTAFVIRITAGGIMLLHGLQKSFGLLVRRTILLVIGM